VSEQTEPPSVVQLEYVTPATVEATSAQKGAAIAVIALAATAVVGAFAQTYIRGIEFDHGPGPFLQSAIPFGVFCALLRWGLLNLRSTPERRWRLTLWLWGYIAMNLLGLTYGSYFISSFPTAWNLPYIAGMIVQLSPIFSAKFILPFLAIVNLRHVHTIPKTSA